MRPLLIYIHGFQSSSQSEKAQETRQYCEQQSLAIDVLTPELSNYPLASFKQLQQIIEQHQHQQHQIALLGSSLGGFMATCLAQRYGLRAVLINPAVRPYELISGVLGKNINPYTGVEFILDESHIDELRELEVTTLSQPEKLLVLLQTGDETLDYHQAVAYYHGCKQVIEAGGNHRFQHFDQHLPAVLKFLELID